MLPDPYKRVPAVAAMTPEAAARCALTAADYQALLLDLLPVGAAWPRELETVIARFLGAVGAEWASIHGRDCDLEAESYPCGAQELLPDWERVLGLPDECTQGIDYPVARRQDIVCAKLATPGGQTAAYYIALAAAYGFTVTIVEHWPWRLGCMTFCDARVGVQAHWWEVVIPNLPVTHLTVGCWRIGEPLCVVEGKDVIECLIRRAAPAHTTVSFSYTLTKAAWQQGRWNFDAWS